MPGAGTRAAAMKVVTSASTKERSGEADADGGDHRLARLLVHPLAADRVAEPVEIEGALAGACGIRPLHRPLIDDTTYLALQDSYLPFHALGVIRIWHDRAIEPAGYLLSRRSAGMIVGCAMLPAHLQRVAARSGEICAIGPATLARISRRSYAPPARP